MQIRGEKNLNFVQIYKIKIKILKIYRMVI
jgi:hypothetical protein